MHSLYQQKTEWYSCKHSYNLTYPTHLHKETELIYVLKGSIEVIIGEITYPLEANDLILISSNQMHHLISKKESELLILIFNGEYIPQLKDLLGTQVPILPYLKGNEVNEDIIYCMNRLLQMKESLTLIENNSQALNNMKLHENHSKNLIPSYLLLIFTHLMNTFTFTLAKADDLNLLHKLILYIDSNYTKDLSLDILAQNLSTNKYYVSRLFSSKLTTTYYEYINSKRLNHCEYLLEHSSHTITEISFLSGFDSIRTFYRIFNSKHKCSPKEYRKQLKNPV